MWRPLVTAKESYRKLRKSSTFAIRQAAARRFKLHFPRYRLAKVSWKSVQPFPRTVVSYFWRTEKTKTKTKKKQKKHLQNIYAPASGGCVKRTPHHQMAGYGPKNCSGPVGLVLASQLLYPQRVASSVTSLSYHMASLWTHLYLSVALSCDKIVNSRPVWRVSLSRKYEKYAHRSLIMVVIVMSVVIRFSFCVVSQCVGTQCMCCYGRMKNAFINSQTY